MNPPTLEQRLRRNRRHEFYAGALQGLVKGLLLAAPSLISLGIWEAIR